MKKNTLKYITLLTLVITPTASFAALGGVKGLLLTLGSFVNILIPILFGLSLVYFFWGISQFILHAGDQKTRQEGKSKMVWGVVALFVFVSIFGIIQWIGKTLDIQVGTTSSSGSDFGCPPVCN